MTMSNPNTRKNPEEEIEFLRKKSISTCYHEIKIDPEMLICSLERYDRQDSKPRFRNSKDPLIVAFNSIDKKSTKRLFDEFIKDSMYEISKFINQKLNKAT